MNKLFAVAAVATAALLSACGGGGGDQPMVAAENTTLAVNSTVTSAVVQTPFDFPAGVSEFGTTAATSVTFTSTATTPAFTIASGSNTASGTTTFGSCIFAVTASNFPASSPLALGKTVTVQPCNLTVATAGAAANGVAATRAIALVLGAAASANASITVGVNPGGQLTLNGNIVGTVTLTPLTGA